MSSEKTLIVFARTKPASTQGFLDLVAGLAKSSRAEAGCIEYKVYRDAGDAATIVFYERWRDQAALEAHGATPAFQEFLRLKDGFLAEDVKITFVDAV